MNKFKKYLKYVLLLVLLFIFVSVMSKLLIISMYKPKECTVLFENPKIEVIDSKATNANGYIYGCITNTTGSTIENKFIKLDCYSEYDNNINTGYAQIFKLEPDESQYFTIKYKCQGTERVEISMSDTAPDYLLNPIDIELTQTQKMALLAGGLIVIYYMPVGYLFGLFPF